MDQKFKIEKAPPVLVEIFGQDVSVNRPSVGQLKAMQAKLAAAPKDEALAVIEEFCKDVMGIPHEALDGMTATQMQELMEHISTRKK